MKRNKSSGFLLSFSLSLHLSLTLSCLLVSLSSRIIVLYVCVQCRKFVVHALYPFFIALWGRRVILTLVTLTATPKVWVFLICAAPVPSDACLVPSDLVSAHWFHHRTRVPCTVTPLTRLCTFGRSCFPVPGPSSTLGPSPHHVCHSSASWLPSVLLNQREQHFLGYSVSPSQSRLHFPQSLIKLDSCFLFYMNCIFLLDSKFYQGKGGDFPVWLTWTVVTCYCTTWKCPWKIYTSKNTG